MTAAPQPLYAPAPWVARRLGISPETFRRRRADFRAAGLPEPCQITGLYLIAAVDALLDARGWLEQEKA